MKFLAVLKLKGSITRNNYRHANKMLELGTKEEEMNFCTLLLNDKGTLTGGVNGNLLSVKDILPKYQPDLKCILSALSKQYSYTEMPFVDSKIRLRVLTDSLLYRDYTDMEGKIQEDASVDTVGFWRKVTETLASKWDKSFFGTALAGLVEVLVGSVDVLGHYCFVIHDVQEPDSLYVVSKGQAVHIEKIKDTVYVTDDERALGNINVVSNFTRNIVTLGNVVDTLYAVRIKSDGIESCEIIDS